MKPTMSPTYRPSATPTSSPTLAPIELVIDVTTKLTNFTCVTFQALEEQFIEATRKSLSDDKEIRRRTTITIRGCFDGDEGDDDGGEEEEGRRRMAESGDMDAQIDWTATVDDVEELDQSAEEIGSVMESTYTANTEESDAFVNTFKAQAEKDGLDVAVINAIGGIGEVAVEAMEETVIVHTQEPTRRPTKGPKSEQDDTGNTDEQDMVVGIGVGGTFGGLILIIVAYYFKQKHDKRKQANATTLMPNNGHVSVMSHREHAPTAGATPYPKSAVSPGTNDWVEHVSQDGQKYYFSPSRKHSTWTKPVDFNAFQPHAGSLGGSYPSPHTHNLAATAPEVIPAEDATHAGGSNDWIMAVSPQGIPYYFSPSRNVSTWTKPEGFTADASDVLSAAVSHTGGFTVDDYGNVDPRPAELTPQRSRKMRPVNETPEERSARKARNAARKSMIANSTDGAMDTGEPSEMYTPFN
jgi:hypothetical protein